MTRRDAYTLGGVVILALVAGFWFMLLAPKRSELSKLDAQIAESQAALQTAQGEAQQFAQARKEFPTDYTTVTRLGEAVPSDSDIASLVVQLDRAASKARVDFRKLVSQSGGGETASAASTPPAAPSGEAAAGSGATGAEGATGATGAAGTTGASGSTAVEQAAADALLTPTVPIGVDVGPAGLSVVKWELLFEGSFYRMADLLHNVRSLVERRNRQIVVAGRLITVGGISLFEGNDGFPQVQASIVATAYLLPQGQGLFAGATPQGPAGATAATPTPPAPAPTTPPVAVVSPR